jgi:hypothetical protein
VGASLYIAALMAAFDDKRLWRCHGHDSPSKNMHLLIKTCIANCCYCVVIVNDIMLLKCISFTMACDSELKCNAYDDSAINGIVCLVSLTFEPGKVVGKEMYSNQLML